MKNKARFLSASLIVALAAPLASAQTTDTQEEHEQPLERLSEVFSLDLDVLKTEFLSGSGLKDIASRYGVDKKVVDEEMEEWQYDEQLDQDPKGQTSLHGLYHNKRNDALLARVLGVSIEELRTERENGTTLQDYAEDLGWEMSDLYVTLRAIYKNQEDQASGTWNTDDYEPAEEDVELSSEGHENMHYPNSKDFLKWHKNRLFLQEELGVTNDEMRDAYLLDVPFELYVRAHGKTGWEIYEAYRNAFPQNIDFDGDGTVDIEDDDYLDDDRDGTMNSEDPDLIDTDHDGIVDANDEDQLDSDGDGIVDSDDDEDGSTVDSDRDGIMDSSDEDSMDSDHDGIVDAEDDEDGTTIDSDRDGVVDADDDDLVNDDND